MQHGEVGNRTYFNSDGAEVTSRFRGLRDLYVIHGNLEDGDEIPYSEYEDPTEEEVLRMITPREELAVFKTDEPE